MLLWTFPSRLQLGGGVTPQNLVCNEVDKKLVNNGGTITVENAGPALISFTISSEQCQGESGMTWGEWLNSTYYSQFHEASQISLKIGGDRGADVISDEDNPEQAVRKTDGGVVRSGDSLISDYSYNFY